MSAAILEEYDLSGTNSFQKEPRTEVENLSVAYSWGFLEYKFPTSWLRTNQSLVGFSPFSVTVTTRIIPFLVGNPYKPSCATVTGKGDQPIMGLNRIRRFVNFLSRAKK